MTTIDIVEDGDGNYNSTGGSWGYYARQFCVYLNAPFSGGPVTIPVTITGNATGDGTYPYRAQFNVDSAGFASFINPLSFTGTGAANQHCVIVQRINNNLDDPSTPILISLGTPTTADSGGVYASEDPCDVTVNIDDDEGPRVLVSNMSNITQEPYGPTYTNGVDGHFTVRLSDSPANTPPTASVTIPINALYDSNNANFKEGRVMDSTCTNEITSLTFTSANWSTPQTVCVKAQADYKDDPDVQYVLQLQNTTSADPNYNGINPRDVTVINQNKDVIGFSYGGFGGSGNTTGSTPTTIAGFATDDMNNFSRAYSCFTLKLRSQPQSDVVLTTHNSTTTNDGTPNLSSLTFTSGNWNVTQQVCVDGASNGSNEGNHDYDISFTVATADPGYSSATPPTFRIRSCDNDGTNMVVPCNFSGSPLGDAAHPLLTTENGTKAGIWLISQSAPGTTVNVTTISLDTTEGTTPVSVSITNSNYNTMVANDTNEIIATGQDDALPDGPISYTITTGIPDSVWTSFNPADIYLKNADNEALYTVSKTGDTAEDNSQYATISVYPNYDHDNPITLTVSCTLSGTECGSLSTTTITFAANVYGSGNAQSVVVHGADDSYADGNKNFSVTFSASTTDPTYAGQNPPSQSVTNYDDEPTGKAVFVTNGTYFGEVGGANGVNDVDTLCQNEANSRSAPSGTYRAFLVGEGPDLGAGNGKPPTRKATSNGTDATGQTNWVLKPNLIYYRWATSGDVDAAGTRLFWTNGFSLYSTLTNPFSTSGSDTYWTGMNSDLTIATSMPTPTSANCNAWSYNQDPGGAPDFYGQYGVGNSTGPSSISSGYDLCSIKHKFICVQQ